MSRFTLHEGDRVEFVSMKGARCEGTLIRRPYGRRLHAVVRDDDRRLHYLPGREFITKPLNGGNGDGQSSTRSS